MPRSLLPILVVFAFFSRLAFGVDVAGDVVNVDVIANTISVSAKGETPKLFKVQPGADIRLNNSGAKLTDLSEGMTAKVISGEPGYATRIEASGEKSGPALAAGELLKRLTGSTWVWSESKDSYEEITLGADGKAKSSARPRPFTWKLGEGGNRIEGLTPWGKRFRINFDASLTKGRLYEADKPARDTKLVTK